MNFQRFSFPLLGLLMSALLGCRYSSSERGERGPRLDAAGAPKEVAATVPASTSEASEARVTIEDFKFEPKRLSVRPGTTVTWVNKDDEPHSATSSGKPKRFDSGALDAAQSFSFTFTEPGSFAYFCKLHPHMTGVVVVQ